MITLKQIKEAYPEGCQVRCALEASDRGVVIQNDIKQDKDAFYFKLVNGKYIYLYNSVTNEFATIIKQAPKKDMKNTTMKKQPSKYQVDCKGVTIDVYDVLKAFNVVNPATQHAIKKLLKGGERGFKDVNKDYQEAIESIERAIELNK
jgi:hypothetical protein